MIRCLRIYWCLGVASAAGLQKPDAVHRTKIMEEREELPPANCIKGEIGVGESDGDTSPHFVEK